MITTSGPDPSASEIAPPLQSVPVTVDSRGRVRASKEQRRLILAEFERSGVSGTQFAKETGLKYSTLTNRQISEVTPAAWAKMYLSQQRPAAS
jgi:hypothetical protein